MCGDIDLLDLMINVSQNTCVEKIVSTNHLLYYNLEFCIGLKVNSIADSDDSPSCLRPTSFVC
jgi:hypothetical protein